MPSIPEKHDNAEVFRRWWKDVAEYCERFPKFPNCSFIFKKMRGYNDAVEKALTVTALFASLDEDMPANQTMHWDMFIAEKELYGAGKYR